MLDQPAVIAQLNIDHFRKMLTTEQDIKTRTMLVRLLAEEEAKLAALKRKSRSGATAPGFTIDRSPGRELDRRA